MGSRAKFGCTYAFLGLGVGLFVVGLCLVFLLDGVIDNVIKDTLELKPKSPTTNVFLQPSFRIRYQVWVYNVTNPNQVMFEGARPVLEEVGPYTWREKQRKDETLWCDNGDLIDETDTKTGEDPNCIDGTLSYRDYTWYYFLQDESYGAEADRLTVPNLVYYQLYNMFVDATKSWTGKPKQYAVMAFDAGMSLMGELPYILGGVRVDELVFKGYKDRILTIATLVKKFIGVDLGVPDKFAMFYNSNGTNEGKYVIDTGKHDPNLLGYIRSWHNKTGVDIWGHYTDNMVNGTDGTIFKPFLKTDDVLPLYVSDICRSLIARYHDKKEIADIPVWRFIIPEDVFAMTPSNQGFCRPYDQPYFADHESCANQEWIYPNGSACLPDGFMYLGGAPAQDCAALDGSFVFAPVFITLPHFLFAPDCVQSYYSELQKPDIDNHAATIYIEPRSGVGVFFQRRLQINVGVGRDAGVFSMKKMPAAVVPLMWLNESALLDDDSAKELKMQIVTLPKALFGVAYALIAVGAAMAIGCAYIAVCVLKRGESNNKVAISISKSVPSAPVAAPRGTTNSQNGESSL